MKTTTLFTTILTLALLTAALVGGYALGRLAPEPETLSSTFPIPPLTPLYLPSQTQNGITASVESYYADASGLYFVIHIEGEDLPFIDMPSLRDSQNQEINTAYGVGNFDNSQSTFFADFTPVTLLQMDKFEGQLSFAVYRAGMDSTPEAFTFDLNIPIRPVQTYDLKQTVQANGIDILLDRVVITPAYTQAYLCYTKPTSADWMIGQDARLQINGKSSSPSEYALLFDSDFGDIGKGGDPDWTLPIQNGRCIKIGFPVGDADPKSFTLTIPMLEQSIPEVIPTEELEIAREKLLPEGIDIGWQVFSSPSGGGGSGPVYNKIPDGMSEQEAYQKFLEALGYFHKGPWVFDVKVQQ